MILMMGRSKDQVRQDNLLSQQILFPPWFYYVKIEMRYVMF